MRRTASLIGAAIVLAAALLAGPFTYYADLVPLLGPVLPRPPSVPRDATAEYNWKASGLRWSWERPLPHGCAAWEATDRYATLKLVLSEGGCDDAGRSLAHTSFSEEIVFDGGVVGWGGRPCPYTITDGEISAFRRLTAEAVQASTTQAERSVLKHVDMRLEAVDGGALTTDAGGGCNDLAPADYGSPSRRIDTRNGPDRSSR